MSQSELIHIKIYAPFKVYFDGTGMSLSATNDTGPFDILAGHKNFISLLAPLPIKVLRPGMPDFYVGVSHGLVHVKANKVTVFLDI